MKTALISVILFICCLVSQAQSNPFSCKLSKKEIQEPLKTSQKIVFKGTATIGDRHYGLVQIGEADFEVLAGETIHGIRIHKIGRSRLDYSIGNKKRSIPLDLK